MECLWCDEEIIPTMTWSNFILLPRKIALCMNCEEGLNVISGARCSLCSRPTEDTTCLDCIKWKNHFEEDVIVRNHSIFSYNAYIKEVVTKWKYRGDYCLGEVFKPLFKDHFHTIFGKLSTDMVAVPIPLSQERLSERGFNQATMLANFLPIETKELLTRIHSEKQSKKTRKERVMSKNPFFLTETVNKSVLLVDDIYTTGTTLRHAATLLREAGCPFVYALTLIRG